MKNAGTQNAMQQNTWWEATRRTMQLKQKIWVHTCEPNLGRRSHTRALCLTTCACKVRPQQHCVWWCVRTNYSKSTMACDWCIHIAKTQSGAKAPQQDLRWTWWHWGFCAGPPLGQLHPLPEPLNQDVKHDSHVSSLQSQNIYFDSEASTPEI